MDEKKIKSMQGFPDENPVMILNSISRMFDFKARKIAESSYMQHSCRVILMCLARCDGMSQVELTDVTHFKAPTVSLDLKKLENMGMVRREQNVSDMRVTRVYLTEKGKAFNRENFEALQAIDYSIMRGLTDDEIKTVTEILLKMRENMIKEVEKK